MTRFPWPLVGPSFLETLARDARAHLSTLETDKILSSADLLRALGIDVDSRAKAVGAYFTNRSNAVAVAALNDDHWGS